MFDEVGISLLFPFVEMVTAPAMGAGPVCHLVILQGAYSAPKILTRKENST